MPGIGSNVSYWDRRDDGTNAICDSDAVDLLLIYGALLFREI